MGSEFPKRFRELRKAKFKSAEQFARLMGVSLKTVQGWENESKDPNPNLKNLEDICSVLGCDMDYLSGRIDEKTHAKKDICNYLGLSEKAVDKIADWKGSGLEAALSSLIESERFADFLNDYFSFRGLLYEIKYYNEVDEHDWVTDFRMREDGEVIISGENALHLFSQKAANTFLLMCDEELKKEIRARNIAPQDRDSKETIYKKIQALEEEIRELTAEIYMYKTEILPLYDNPDPDGNDPECNIGLTNQEGRDTHE